MSRSFKYPITAERLEELYTTEMNAEERSLWSSCLKFIIKYFGCSKQLADVRIREWLLEYPHDLLKIRGGRRFYDKNTSAMLSSKCYRCTYYIRCKEYEKNADSVSLTTDSTTINKYEKNNNYDKIIIQEKTR